MKVAMSEFKAGLSRYVARARAGEVIELTSHAKPVARLVGIATEQPPGIQRLLATGAAQWAGGKPGLWPPLVCPAPTQGSPPSLSDTVLEGRG